MRPIVEAIPPKQVNGEVKRKEVKKEPNASPTQPAEAQNDGEEKKTPYQGRHRSYGLFRCTECKKQWSSGNSWANMGQECTVCRINIYPFRQLPLLRTKKSSGGEGKHHLTELCEKCKSLGYSCRERPPPSEKKKKKKKKIGKATTPNP